MKFFFPFFGFLRPTFSVVLKPILELALVNQAGLELTDLLASDFPSAGIKSMHQTTRIYDDPLYTQWPFLPAQGLSIYRALQSNTDPQLYSI